MLPVGIGDAIRARRERVGLTQEALAALLGVHPDAVDDWEWGEGAPDPARARRLAAILDLSEGSLFPESPPAGGAPVLVLLEPAGEAPRLLRPRPASGNLVPVPPRPGGPPPLPAVPGAAGRVGPARAATNRAAAAPARRQRRFRQMVGGVVAALLVSVAAVSGVAAYRQAQVAAAREAEARALRHTLVALAGERDRLAARIVELTAVLAEAGFGARADSGRAVP